ncbi:MAG: YcnI family protein [Actinomycetes bacterium]
MPGTIAPGEAATFAFQVPNERDDSATTSVQITFPTSSPIAEVKVEPIAGWNAVVETTPLSKPIDVDGTKFTEAVSTITWTGGRIEPGEFQQFVVDAGPIPDVTSLEFKAVQTYADGQVVRWIEPTPANGEEPEYPAPVVEVSAGEPTPSSSPSDGTKTLAIASLAISVLAVALGAGAFMVGRKPKA